MTLTPQERAAKATYLLIMNALEGCGERAMTMREITETVELQSHQGFYALMDNLSRAGIPVYCPEPGRWALNVDGLPPIFSRRQTCIPDLELD